MSRSTSSPGAVRIDEGAAWSDLSSSTADPALKPRFRRDQAMLWVVSIGLPFVLTALFKAIGSLL